MGSQRATNTVTVQDDEYFGDFYSDDRALVEGMDPDDLYAGSPANEEVWDVLEIQDDDWFDVQQDAY